MEEKDQISKQIDDVQDLKSAKAYIGFVDDTRLDKIAAELDKIIKEKESELVHIMVEDTIRRGDQESAKRLVLYLRDNYNVNLEEISVEELIKQ